MHDFLQDVRFGARTLLKHPGFTLVACCSLALGIGAVTTVYSMVSSVLLHPLPFEDGHRIVAIENVHLKKDQTHSVSYPLFHDWEEQNSVFEHVAVFSGGAYNLTGPEGPERVQSGYVNSGFFPLLRVSPVLGRSFSPDEDAFENDHVAMLSHKLWTNRYQQNEDIIGKMITLDGEGYTVVGVVPEDFRFVEVGPADVWVPAQANGMAEHRSNGWLRAMARLKDGTSIEQAQAEMSVIMAGLTEEYPDHYTERGARLTPLGQAYTDATLKVAFIILLGSVGFVLLISCVNVANLLLARVTARRKEITVRVALGASRARIVRQLLTESLLLGLLGGSLGMLVGFWGHDFVAALLPPDDAQFYIEYFQFKMNPEVFAVTAGVAILSAMFFGLIPALQATGLDLNEALKDGGAAGGGRKRHRILNGLVVSEVALALVLLISAGLMIRSYQNLQQVDPGFDTSNILTIGFSLPEQSYPELEQVTQFYEAMEDRIAAVGGVMHVGNTTILPLTGRNSTTSLAVETLPEPEPGNHYYGGYRSITPAYFETMGIPLLDGRALTRQDNNADAPVAIINETMARMYWPDESAVGKRFKTGGYKSESPWMTVVGVVGGIRHNGLDEQIAPELFTASAQNPRRFTRTVIRTEGDPTAIASSVREIVHELDPNLPLIQLQPMEDYVREAIWQNRFNTILFGTLAGIALVLSTLGVYGVISYMVAQRTHEIGIRMALGAHQGRVLGLVVRSGLRLAVFGIVIGLPVAFGLTRLLSSLLYGVGASDPRVFVSIAVLLAAVAMLASYMPARRATHIDPIEALRYE